jgi:hypothetical protein
MNLARYCNVHRFVPYAFVGSRHQNVSVLYLMFENLVALCIERSSYLQYSYVVCYHIRYKCIIYTFIRMFMFWRPKNDIANVTYAV